MANNLTGDYEAVFQVSVRQINGLLATLHQNGAIGSSVFPNFPHSAGNLRVGEVPKYLTYELTQFSNWVSEAVQSYYVPGGTQVTGADLAATAPAGIARHFRTALEDIASSVTQLPSPGSVRGRAEAQMSTPTISLPPGSSDKIVVSVEIRARFVPDAGSGPLPAPIHGVISGTYVVRSRNIAGKNVLTVDVPQDEQIVFKDLAGLNAAQVAALLTHIRYSVREQFKPKPVDLPGEFDVFQFREIGGGKAIAMPVQLSAGPPPPALQSLTTLFLDPDTTDFAFAVSKEYVTTKFAPTLDSLRQDQESFEVQLPDYVPWPNPTYHLAVTGVDLQFVHGAIDLIIKARATTNAVGFPDYDSVVITQRMRLILAAVGLTTIGPTQTVALLASDNELTISGITGLGSSEATEEARKRIITARDNALPPVRESLHDAVRFDQLKSDGFPDPDTSKPPGAGKRLLDTLKKLDDSGTAHYTAIQITPDGVIVSGAIDTKYHYQPQMAIGYTEDGKSFSALDCWIPGGRITNYTWYWAEELVIQLSSGVEIVFPGEGEQKSSSQPHRFTFDIPAVIKNRPSWSKGVCVTLEGEQIDRDGRIISVSGFEKSGSCEITSHMPILVADPLWEAVYGILWGPRPPEGTEGPYEEQIQAHINLLAHRRPAGGLTTNALIHFAGSEPDAPLQTLSRALEGMTHARSVTMVLVMPVGTFRRRRGEIRELLGVGREIAAAGADRRREVRIRPSFLLTEDYNGAWTRTFDAQGTPATYLMNARGEFVWKQESRIDVAALTAAMDEHFWPAPPPEDLPLRLTVRPGDRAPEAVYDTRYMLPLDRLRGQQVLLNFWQSWSAPCVRELRRLQHLHDEAGKHGLMIMGVNGEARGVLAEMRKQYNLTFPMIHDPGGRVAARYGVQCWPTTVSINPEGIVDRIQFGATHSHRAEQHDTQAS